MSEPSSLSDANRYEQACDQAIAMCVGNLRSTIKALIMATDLSAASAAYAKRPPIQIQPSRTGRRT